MCEYPVNLGHVVAALGPQTSTVLPFSHVCRYRMYKKVSISVQVRVSAKQLLFISAIGKYYVYSEQKQEKTTFHDVYLTVR